MSEQTTFYEGNGITLYAVHDDELHQLCMEIATPDNPLASSVKFTSTLHNKDFDETSSIDLYTSSIFSNDESEEAEEKRSQLRAQMHSDATGKSPIVYHELPLEIDVVAKPGKLHDLVASARPWDDPHDYDSSLFLGVHDLKEITPDALRSKITDLGMFACYPDEIRKKLETCLLKFQMVSQDASDELDAKLGERRQNYDSTLEDEEVQKAIAALESLNQVTFGDHVGKEEARPISTWAKGAKG